MRFRIRRPSAVVAVRSVVVAIVLGQAAIATSCTEAFAPDFALTAPRVVAVELSQSEVYEGGVVEARVIVATPKGRADSVDAAWWTCPDVRGTFLDPSAACDARIDLGVGETHSYTSRRDLFGDSFGGRDEATPFSATERYFGAALGHRSVLGVTVQTDEGPRDAFARVTVYPDVNVPAIAPALEDAVVFTDDDGGIRSNIATSVTAVRLVDDAGDEVARVARGQTVRLVPEYDTDTLETYRVVDADLRSVDLAEDVALLDLSDADIASRFTEIVRCEVPTFQWMVSAGSVRRYITRDVNVLPRVFVPRGESCEFPGPDEDAAVRYTYASTTPTPTGGVVHGEVVVRDGRGLERALSFSFLVEESDPDPPGPIPSF